ncbi:MAG: ABC transporter permease [Aggregatilineales bacterium]
MTKYLVKRLIGAAFTLLGVSLVVFLLLRMLPGDPARLLAGLTATPEEIEFTRARLGLDDPLPVQFFSFLGDLAQGDFGTSTLSRQPVMKEIAVRLPYTARLTLTTMVLTMSIGIPLGVLAAVRRNSRLDVFISTVSLLGISLPSYALGIMFIVIFAVKLQWLPAAGADGWQSLILPSTTLTVIFLAIIVRITRASMVDALSQDYVRTAHSKGLRPRKVINTHALRNALIPVVTILGLQFGGLMSGAVLTETVFAYPGVGLLLTESIFNRDFPMVQGVVLLVGFIFVVVNLGVDLLYTAIDPRIRYA